MLAYNKNWVRYLPKTHFSLEKALQQCYWVILYSAELKACQFCSRVRRNWDLLDINHMLQMKTISSCFGSVAKKKNWKITFDTKLSYEVSSQNKFLFIAGRSYNKSKSVCQFKAKHPLVRYWSCVRGKC